MYYGYPKLPQLRRRSNTRQRKDMWRSDSAGTEDDFLAIDGKLFMAADYAQSYRSLAFEDDPVDEAVGPDGQPRSRAHGVKVADCRTHPHAAVNVEC